MAPAEVAAFLEEQRVMICASNGVRGWPHLMPLWYLMRGEEPWAWTYARSQKVRNLERDPRATLQVETGVQYHELRGVMVQAQTVIHRELEPVNELGTELLARYGGGGQSREAREAIRAQAAKRVALQFRPEQTGSWDHRKLGELY